MSITIKRLRRLQIAQEVTENTEANATAVFIPTTAVFVPAHTVVTPEQDIGLLTRRHPGQVAAKLFTFDIGFDASYEQLLYPLNNVMKAVQSGVGAGADKTYAFAPSPTGADGRLPMTMETRYSDGTNNIDRTYTGCTGQELVITGVLNGLTTGSWKGFARAENANAITAALSAPATLTLPVGQDWKLYVDANWAALGTTAVGTQLQGFTWTYNSGYAPKYYMDGSKDVTRARRGMRDTTLSLNLDQEASSGYAATLRAAVESRALQYIQLRATGGALGSSNYLIKIDGAYTVESVSGVEDNDEEDAVTVELRGVYDVTGAADSRVTVVTAAATLT